MREQSEEIKMYSDFQSPYAYLALDPVFELEHRFRVSIRWIPFQLQVEPKELRSEHTEWKVRYAFLDARRWAALRGGIILKGPRRVYDTTQALIGGLFADQQGRLLDYSRAVFARFFQREIELDDGDSLRGLIAELGMSLEEYQEYASEEGIRALHAAREQAAADHVFGVPTMVFRGEPFWGHDRIGLLELRLAEEKLRRDDAVRGFTS